eukprot:9170601-Pyramimonas_sp.AAC.1
MPLCAAAVAEGSLLLGDTAGGLTAVTGVPGMVNGMVNGTVPGMVSTPAASTSPALACQRVDCGARLAAPSAICPLWWRDAWSPGGSSCGGRRCSLFLPSQSGPSVLLHPTPGGGGPGGAGWRCDQWRRCEEWSAEVGGAGDSLAPAVAVLPIPAYHLDRLSEWSAADCPDGRTPACVCAFSGCVPIGTRRGVTIVSR